MLLPSAFNCDSTTPLTRQQSQRYASPPVSPPLNATSTLLSTCRALQSMLSSPSTTPAQLPTPPMSHAPVPSPFKLRLRSRRPVDGERKKIVKRAPPRGANKRRRAIDDEGMRDDSEESDEEVGGQQDDAMEDVHAAPSTPKRLRLAPEVLPLGLGRRDFYSLAETQEMHQRHQFSSSLFESRNMNEERQTERGMSGEDGEEEWTGEDDRILVELVLEKLKLSKSDWVDCARSLGRDRGSVGRRWKSLVGGGDVGLKRRGAQGSRRAGIHGTWR